VSTGVEVNKILSSDAESNDQFGYSVSISGDYAIVGATQKNNTIGAAYIFKKNTTGQFVEVNKILASNGGGSDEFGFSVSISGDYAIVGAYAEDTTASDSGAAYIFKKNSTGGFEEVNMVIASDGAASDEFGFAVSISGDYCIVGASGKNETTGAAYIFKKNSSGQFEEVNKIIASDVESGDEFGSSVSISGDYAIISASQKNEATGAAYIFKKNSTGQFEEVNKIIASDAELEDEFGSSVSISGDYAIVGAYAADTTVSDAGAAYIFKKNSTGQFEEVNKIIANDGELEDSFGISVSISGDYATIGAYLSDTNPENSGAAYIFKKNSTGQFEEMDKILASSVGADEEFGYSVSISGDHVIVGAYLDDFVGNDAGAAHMYKLEISPFECAPTLDTDWTITDSQTCDMQVANTGTGKIVIGTNGTLTLTNSSNVTTSGLEILRTGDSVFIQNKSELRIL